MAKQRADNGIDYTPRRPKAIQAAAEARNPQQRHTHGVVQHKQHYPIFEVTAAGRCVQWTEKRGEAHTAFADASVLPKLLCVVHENGRRQLLDMVSATGRRPAQPELQKLAA
jgi:hypothetical protein